MSLDLGRNLLTVFEVSNLLKISTITVYKYIKEQELEAIQIGGHYRISQQALENFLQKRTVKKSE